MQVAFVRDPVDRLKSAWRSKIACDSEGFKTDFGMPTVTMSCITLMGDWLMTLCLRSPKENTYTNRTSDRDWGVETVFKISCSARVFIVF